MTACGHGGSRFGPDITISISPGYKLCKAILEHVAGVFDVSIAKALGSLEPSSLTPDNSTHSIVSPSLRGLGYGVISPFNPSGSFWSAGTPHLSLVAWIAHQEGKSS